MGMSIDDLKKECKYCCREIDNSGLEGFRCTNKTVIKTTDSSWCYPKNADEPCSICKYCEPKEEIEMTIDKAIPKIQFVRNALNDDMEIAKAYDLAISTMRKYQKIEEIVKFGNANELGFEYVGEKITEVLEDGIDD